MRSTAARRTAAAAVAAVALTGTGTALADPGTGLVTDTLVATVVPGLLTIAGAGAQVGLSGTPGEFTPAAGATLITVSDLTLSDAGWAVTASYTDPVAGAGLGGDNVQVAATSVTGDLLPSALTLADYLPLDVPVTVASTGLAAGNGVTAFTAKYKVRIPADAQLGDTYGGTVTYTVASVR